MAKETFLEPADISQISRDHDLVDTVSLSVEEVRGLWDDAPTDLPEEILTALDQAQAKVFGGAVKKSYVVIIITE